jgi:hypothetical protein
MPFGEPTSGSIDRPVRAAEHDRSRPHRVMPLQCHVVLYSRISSRISGASSQTRHLHQRIDRCEPSELGRLDFAVVPVLSEQTAQRMIDAVLDLTLKSANPWGKVHSFSAGAPGRKKTFGVGW